jgi:hypothetical protein
MYSQIFWEYDGSTWEYNVSTLGVQCEYGSMGVSLFPPCDTSISQMYASNVAKLQSIRQASDPENVMYLTGGFKL